MPAAHPLAKLVRTRFDGVLTKGAHSPDGKACLHEAINVARGLDWSDSPGPMPDLRGLNDAPWSSDAVRTKHLLPVGIALWDWAGWPQGRRVAFAKRVAEGNIRTILPMALRAAAKVHPDDTHRTALEAAATRCAAEGTGSAAESAAWSAESAAESAWSAESAARSAWSAAESAARSAAESAAESAAWSAAWSAWSAESADAPLIAICALLVKAAKETK